MNTGDLNPAIPLRSPETVMRLARLGAAHPSRLSFARVLLRRAQAEGWRITRPIWTMDPKGFGHAVYRVDTPARTYSLVAFSRMLEPERRTDRVIAEAWDTSYVLFGGMPDPTDIARLEREVPLQEAGRFTESELILSRANKSVRLFDGLARCLASGSQPDARVLDDVGYLMRTTAVYGNGKFGIADRELLVSRPELDGPFQAEMLTVWLIRTFTVDLLDHCAAALDPAHAVCLAPELRRRLGVGNSTGLGMAPFLVRHPILVHRWITARETALARVRSLPRVDKAARAALARLLDEARQGLSGWRTEDEIQAARIAVLREDLDGMIAHFGAMPDPERRPWDALYSWTEAHLGVEAQELLVSLLIEPYGALVDDLAREMSADERDSHAIDGTMPCGDLRGLIERDYQWALDLDFERETAQARFWYVSAEKLEPRLGERFDEPGADLEQPLAFGREVTRLHSGLAEMPDARPVADLLAADPAQRHVVRRVQVAARYPYAEIRDNLIDAAMRPIDMLRCKLAFFGASRFDPRSDRWLRISLFQGAPFPEELGASEPLDTAA